MLSKFTQCSAHACEFCQGCALCKIKDEAVPHLKTWYDTVMNADWHTPSDVKKTYATASILKDSRIVFNIKGNSYRLIAKFNFEKQWVFIRFIGTHKEYDKVDANSI
jgi:mRNA interferase HigB